MALFISFLSSPEVLFFFFFFCILILKNKMRKKENITMSLFKELQGQCNGIPDDAFE
jgi:hypothetical protein